MTDKTIGLLIELFKSIFSAIWEIIKVIVQVILIKSHRLMIKKMKKN